MSLEPYKSDKWTIEYKTAKMAEKNWSRLDFFVGKAALAAYSCVATCRVAGDNMLLEETISGQACA